MYVDTLSCFHPKIFKFYLPVAQYSLREIQMTPDVSIYTSNINSFTLNFTFKLFLVLVAVAKNGSPRYF